MCRVHWRINKEKDFARIFDERLEKPEMTLPSHVLFHTDASPLPPARVARISPPNVHAYYAPSLRPVVPTHSLLRLLDPYFILNFGSEPP